VGEEGFWICSSSVDRVVEETDLMDPPTHTDPNTDIHVDMGSSSCPYNRGHMSMEGFIGTGDGSGGTTLILFLETGGGSYEGQGMPDWLVRHALERDLLDTMRGIKAVCTCISRDSYTRSMDSSYQAAFSSTLSPLKNPDSCYRTENARESESESGSGHRGRTLMPPHTPSMHSRPVSVPISVPVSLPVTLPGSGSASRPLSVPVSVSGPMSGWRKGIKLSPVRDGPICGDYLELEDNPSNSFTPYSPTSVRSIMSVLSEDNTFTEKSSDRRHATSFGPTGSYHTQTRPTSTSTITGVRSGGSRSAKEGESVHDLQALSPLSTGDSAMRVDTRRQGISTGREGSAQSVKNARSQSDRQSERSAGGVESLRAKVTNASCSPPFTLTPTPEGCSALTSEDTGSSPWRRREERSIERESSEVYVPAPRDGDGPITPLFLDEGVRLIQRYFGVREEGTGVKCTAPHTEPLTQPRPKSMSRSRPEDSSDLGLEWQCKGERRGVSVSSSMVRGSTWQVGSIPFHSIPFHSIP
jgi:hypothetical protein